MAVRLKDGSDLLLEARRLAVLMHRIWSDGTEVRWTKDPLVQPSL